MATVYNPIGWANRVQKNAKKIKKSDKNQLTNAKGYAIVSCNKKES